MKLNTTFLISILLLIILAIGAVSASEDISDETIAAEPSDEIISDQIDDGLEETDSQDEVLEEENEELTLSDFKTKLESDETEITLENDYKYSSGDEEITSINTANKPVVIDGKGHTVDGAGADIRFYINGRDTVLKNLVFKNFHKDDGDVGRFGFIYWDGLNGRLENCTFENFTDSESGAVLAVQNSNFTIYNCTINDNDVVVLINLYYSNAQINNCGFSNNSAVYFLTDYDRRNNIQINNCSFYDNNATYFIEINGNNSQINNCTFVNNTGGGYGYITCQDGNNSSMYNCTFERNYAALGNPAFPITWFGDLTYPDKEPTGENISVTKVTFKDNVGIPIRWQAVSGNVTECIFENNNGTIQNQGNVYRDNGKYDFEVTVYNDTVIGLPEGSSSSENTLLEVNYYGSKSGNILVLLDGVESYNKEMESDSISISIDEIENPKVGEVPIIVKFISGENDWVIFEGNATIDYYLGIDNLNLETMIPPHATLDLSISLPEDATGTLIFSDGIKNITIEYSEGKATYSLDASIYTDFDEYMLAVSLVGDLKYPDKTSYYPIALMPVLDIPIYVSLDEIDYVLYDFPDSERYLIFFDYDEESRIHVDKINGSGMATIPDLDLGVNRFYVMLNDYPGGRDYVIYCIENQEGFDSSIESDSILLGEDAVITVSSQNPGYELNILIDCNSPAFALDGNYMSFDLTDSPFTYNISNLAAGVHKIKVLIYNEEELVIGYSNNFIVTVKEAPTIAKILAVNNTVDSCGLLQLKVLTADDEPISNERLSFAINGKEYASITDDEGIANFVLKDLSNGNYTVEVDLDEKYNVSNPNVSFEKKSSAVSRILTQIVYKNMTTTAVDVDTDGRIGEYFVVTLKDANGKALVGKAVQIGFNGVVYNRVTDNNGQAKLQINLVRTDIYTFAVCFLGDDEYNGSFVVAKITVNQQKGSLTVPNKSYSASAKTKSLTATFKSASGKLVANKKVTFTVNGKSYSATTNANGVATVNVSLNKKGTYSFTAKFAGDGTYTAISKSAKLTIK